MFNLFLLKISKYFRFDQEVIDLVFHSIVLFYWLNLN